MRFALLVLLATALLCASGCTYFKALLGGSAIGGALLADALERHAQRGMMQDFALTMFDGTEKRLEDFRGQPVVLNFWADW